MTVSPDAGWPPTTLPAEDTTHPEAEPQTYQLENDQPGISDEPAPEAEPEAAPEEGDGGES